MEFLSALHAIGGNIWLYGGTFILVLSLLVFVHEWGHYIVARLCGVRVESFSIGFGPEIVGFNDKHGTRWKISAVPLGGYVQLFGFENPENETNEKTGKKRKITKAERDTALFAKPVWQRAAVVFAGPAINYIFAFILLSGLFMFNGQPLTPPVASAVVQGSSADENGFRPHDVVLSIDGTSVKSFEQIRRSMMVGLDDEKHFVVERGGQEIDIYAKPKKVEQEDRFGFKNSRGLLGLISAQHAVPLKNIRKINARTYTEGDVDAIRRDLEKRMGTTFNIQMGDGEDADVLTINPLAAFNENISTLDHVAYNVLFVGDRDGNVFVKYNFGEAVVKAGAECVDITMSTLKALGQIFTGNRSVSELGGVIRIGALAGDMAQQGMIALILFTALLSINLGLINLFPIPLLDGGHLVFYAFEAMLGRPVPEKFQEYAFRFGLVFLIGVMVYTNLNDLVQLFMKMA